MQPIDFIYRFDPNNNTHVPPADADEARNTLERGNRLFARWVDSCTRDANLGGTPPNLIVPCNPIDLGVPIDGSTAAVQAPFAGLLGCADARVPAELIFGQMRNSLFTVRVAGNVLSDECQGSLEYAMAHMPSLRILVVLGHTGCGAVTAAVDTYLDTRAYLKVLASHSLRAILDRIFVPVRAAADALKHVWGPNAADQPEYRAALVETAVVLNVLLTSMNLRQVVEHLGKPDIKVCYGVFDLVTHRVWTVPTTDPKQTFRETILADAPATLDDMLNLAGRAATWAIARARPK